MDPITTSIVIILGKYALDKGVELGKEVGPKALETAKEMFNLALDHLRRNPKGEVIAGEFEQDPKTYQKPVEKALAEATQADADLAAKLKALLERYEAAAKEHAAMTGKTYRVSVSGSGAAAVGERAVAAGKGGTAIGGDVIYGDKVGRDKVAGDKVTVSTHVRDVHGGTVITAGRGVTYRAGAAGDELSAVFAAFLQELQAQADLSPQDKAEVEGEVKALEATLKSDEPDLGTVQRVKRFFREKGGWLATAGLALFSNPSVVAVVQAATKRLMGG